MTEAVVFDLDGVIVDSEQVWDEVRAEYARETGGRYGPDAARAMMGMSSTEWSAYMAEALGVPRTPEQINADVVERMLTRYGTAPPLIEGAVEYGDGKTDSISGITIAGVPICTSTDGNEPLPLGTYSPTLAIAVVFSPSSRPGSISMRQSAPSSTRSL